MNHSLRHSHVVHVHALYFQFYCFYFFVVHLVSDYTKILGRNSENKKVVDSKKKNNNNYDENPSIIYNKTFI